ncbi:MAG: nucleotidyl transferase AbiEii/AbiGii toxin family protein [Bacillota bacterium]|nr:nucleotidyl transferase AbiEii/AbiGii toxin family protein [Bacillota bacterium]
MHSAVNDMLSKYKCITADDYREALREIIQEIALLGLYRSNFFDRACFYGGTALRIFYGLDRFSEDLDFSLDSSDSDFTLDPYLKHVVSELSAFGFIVDVSKKAKSLSTAIESAFIKAGTEIHFLKIGLREGLFPRPAKTENLKVKLEVDTNPPGEAEYSVKYHLNPVPFNVRLMATPYLFACKVHALLCREWGGGRIKGRDLYDYVWFISQKTPLQIHYLADRMKQSGHLDASTEIDRAGVIGFLLNKFREINYIKAKSDIFPFIKEPQRVEIWSEEFFTAITRDQLIIDFHR